MQNAWNVIWRNTEGKKLIRKFEGDSPRESGAIAFGKKLQSQGWTVDIVSRRKGFAPPTSKLEAPEYGMLWCPYCLKWREFREFSVKTNGFRGPLIYRCPVCTISIRDFYVRKYNFDMVSRLDARMRSRIPTERAIRRQINSGGRRGNR